MKPYPEYYPIDFDYVKQLPKGWRLLPNIAIFDNKNDKGHVDEELLSVTISKGVVKQSEIDKNDSSNPDKSIYKLVQPGDLVYSMRFRQGACGYSNYKGIVSNACTVLQSKIECNIKFFHFQFRLPCYKDYIKRFSYGIADGQLPLRWHDFKRMHSVFPPINIQNSIVYKLELIENSFNNKLNQLEKVFGKKITVQSEFISDNYYDALVTNLIFGQIDVKSIIKDDIKYFI